jgi:hypothetical protein
MGIAGGIADELETLFNHWSTLRITDTEVRKLVQVAMAPNKEVLKKLQDGDDGELSAAYNNIIGKVYEYAMTAESQQMLTTAGTVFGAYNAVTGYFQNVRNYKNEEAKFKSIMDGTAKLRAQTAFDLCRNFSKHGESALILN